MANRFPLIINPSSSQIQELASGDLLDLTGSNIYNGTATLTLPASTDTLVGRATTDTLTNKTLTYPVIDNIKYNMSQIVTAAGTTTLTSASNLQQRFTGTTTQTVVLPVTSTLSAGTRYIIENASTGNITVNSSGGNLVATVIPGTTVEVSCIGTTLTTAADWDAEYFSFGSITGTGSCVLSVSPTLTTPNIGAATGTSLSVSGSLTSTVATGTAPLVVTSTTKVTNLNAEMVDGYHADTANTASTVAVRDASKNLAVSGVVLSGSTSGTSTLVASAAAGTTTHTLPAVTGTIITTGDTGTVTNTMLAGSIANAKLANSTISGVALGSNLNALTIGTGLSGTSYNGSAAVTIALANTTVTAGSYGSSTAVPVITVDAQGRITAASTASISGSISVTGGDLTMSGSTGTAITNATLATVNANVGSFGSASAIPVITVNGKGLITAVSTASVSIPGTLSNVQYNSFGVGTAASGTAGEIRATNAITSYYSDDNLKTRLGKIDNALSKVLTLDGFYYEANETAQSLGYEVKREVGVSAQQVQAVLPEVVVPAPIDDKYLTVHYERLVPLLIEAIKEQQTQIDALTAKVDWLTRTGA